MRTIWYNEISYSFAYEKHPPEVRFFITAAAT